MMEDSKRKKQLLRQIEDAKITTKAVIQYNKGYKQCKKNLRVNKPNYDLEDALKNVFKHALDQGYSRIMVLEDDCEFDERIRDPAVVNNLRTFLNERDPEIYNLGTTISIPSPIDVLLHNNHQRLLFTTCAHAVIYNKKYMENALTREFMSGHTDFEMNRIWSKYTYMYPLAYQKITETENAKEGWGDAYFLLNNTMFKPLKLHTQVQPGFDRLKIVFDYISVVLFLIFLFYVIRKLK
tara:strand:- start:5763 stop:6476 length:714 start_codon:yes stop_codon:yes gene_type:complete